MFLYAIRRHGSYCRAWVPFVALFILLCGQAAVQAEYVIFRNECKVPVIVQTASVVRGVLKRDQTLLKPGEFTTRIPLDRDQVITVCDGINGRTLFRDPLRTSKTPMHYGIVPNQGKVPVRMMPRKPGPGWMPPVTGMPGGSMPGGTMSGSSAMQGPPANSEKPKP